MIKTKTKNENRLTWMFKTANIILSVLLISTGNAWAQDRSAGQPLPLFQSDEILYLDLEADFKKVFSVKDDSTYFPARISFTDDSGQEKALEIEIRTRGKTRRESDVCNFPPLRLNFQKKGTENTPFEGQKSIKLVTHCAKSEDYEQNIITEYLIYKAFNILTDSSFRVRPAMISYIFSGKKVDTVQRFAFFIEREKHMADRLHGIEIETKKMNPTLLNPYHSCLMDIFQYMIGNTDYSVYDLHNIILVADSARKNPPVGIPYDFDWSGLVKATYAVPHPIIGTEDVTQRVYRGFKKEPGIVYQTIDVFKAKKQEIYRLFEDFELLDNYNRKQAINYLNEFYKIINDEYQIKTEFIDRARVVRD